MCLCPQQAEPAQASQGAEWSLPPAGPSLAGLCSARAVGDTGLVPNIVRVGLGQGPPEPCIFGKTDMGDQRQGSLTSGQRGSDRGLGDEPGDCHPSAGM